MSSRISFDKLKLTDKSILKKIKNKSLVDIKTKRNNSRIFQVEVKKQKPFSLSKGNKKDKGILDDRKINELLLGLSLKGEERVEIGKNKQIDDSLKTSKEKKTDSSTDDKESRKKEQRHSKKDMQRREHKEKEFFSDEKNVLNDFPLKRKKKVINVVSIYDGMRVSKLAHNSMMSLEELLKKLKDMGLDSLSKDSNLDLETIQLIVNELGHTISIISSKRDIRDEFLSLDKTALLKSRDPIVIVVGHIDHGKTTLLDMIMKTQVAKKEAGKITQKINAHQVEFNSRKITFLDTPGHEFFNRVRSSGVELADIALLVVSADDSVKPQTIEAINIIKKIDIPVIVAVNKCDLQDVDPDIVLRDLMNYGIVCEKFGGPVMSVNISAKKGTNVTTLLEKIILQADILELKANLNRRANTVIIDSRKEKGKGVVLTMIIKGGVLRKGDFFVVGRSFGRVKKIQDSLRGEVTSAGVSCSVEIVGCENEVEVGEELFVVENENLARKIVKDYIIKNSDVLSVSYSQNLDRSTKEKINVVIKAGTKILCDALEDVLGKIKSIEGCEISIVQRSVGDVVMNDIFVATASRAILIAFCSKINKKMRSYLNEAGIVTLEGNIIYEVVEKFEKIIQEKVALILKEIQTGKAKVVRVFNKRIAGCILQRGFVEKGFIGEVLRDNTSIHRGSILSIRCEKDYIDSYNQIGGGIGIIIENCPVFEENDTILFYKENIK